MEQIFYWNSLLGFKRRFMWKYIDLLILKNFIFISFIILLVLFIMVSLMFNEISIQTVLELENLEFVWTVLPSVFLVFFGLESLNLLYVLEEKTKLALTLKIFGNQWYWNYDYRGFNDLCFDSFIKPLSGLNGGMFRLLEVDNNTVIPVNRDVLCLISSNDVIHRWAIPALSLKIDANPGRLNAFLLKSCGVGLFYGQCSEICGANHSFMPICVEVTTPFLFKIWTQAWSAQ